MLSCTQCNNSVQCEKPFVECLNRVFFAVHSLISHLCSHRRWKQMGIKIVRAGYVHQGQCVRRLHPARMSVALLVWKEQWIFYIYIYIALHWSGYVNVWYYWAAAILFFFFIVSVALQNPSFMGVRGAALQFYWWWNYKWCLRYCQMYSRRKAPAVGDPVKWKTEPSWKWDQSKLV